MERYAAPLNLDNPELACNHVLERGRIAHEASILAGGNLLIAQHRDKPQ